MIDALLSIDGDTNVELTVWRQNCGTEMGNEIAVLRMPAACGLKGLKSLFVYKVSGVIFDF